MLVNERVHVCRVSIVLTHRSDGGVFAAILVLGSPFSTSFIPAVPVVKSSQVLTTGTVLALLGTLGGDGVAEDLRVQLQGRSLQNNHRGKFGLGSCRTGSQGAHD